MAFSKFQPTSILTAIASATEQEKKDAPGLSFQNELTPTLTYGPNANELFGEIPFNEGTAIYDVYLLQQISSDIILMYGSFYAQMYRKTRTVSRARHTPRSVKDQLLREYFPVHKVRNR